MCDVHNEADLSQLHSDDLTKRYRYALELAQAGNTVGFDVLCEAIATQAWKHISLYDVIDVLGETGDERSVDTFITFLSQWMGHARGNALAALLKIGTEKAVNAVFEELRTPSPWFGWGTAGLVAEYGEKYLPCLLLTSRDDDSLLRARSIYALGLILATVENTSILDTLVAALQDSEAEVRQRAAWGLARTHPAAIENALLAALHDDDIEVTQWAAEGLYDFEAHRDQALDTLINSLQHEDSLIRRNAAWALKRIGDVRAVPALIQMLQTDERRGPKCYAIDALAQLQDERAVTPLFASLHDEDEMVRAESVKALANLLGFNVLPKFVELLFDTDMVVQAAVIEVWEQHHYHPEPS